jgi:hypothetical protein
MKTFQKFMTEAKKVPTPFDHTKLKLALTYVQKHYPDIEQVSTPVLTEPQGVQNTYRVGKKFLVANKYVRTAKWTYEVFNNAAAVTANKGKGKVGMGTINRDFDKIIADLK